MLNERRGVVMVRFGVKVRLRPECGGVEWDVDSRWLEAPAVNPARRQAAAALAKLADALTAAKVGLADVGDGWRLTSTGDVLVQLRPLRPDEITRLAKVIRAARDQVVAPPGAISPVS